MDPSQRTAILSQAAGSEGDSASAREQLWPEVYEELRRLAARYMRAGRHPQVTLEPTVLVHEAFVRLVDHHSLDAAARTHFFAIAANAMRYVLADYARRRHAEKRGGKADRVTLHSGIHDLNANAPLDGLALHEALAALERRDERAYRIIELRFFGGLSIEETARTLGVSAGTVKNEWRWSRAWLLEQLASTRAEAAPDADASGGASGVQSVDASVDASADSSADSSTAHADPC